MKKDWSIPLVIVSVKRHFWLVVSITFSGDTSTSPVFHREGLCSHVNISKSHIFRIVSKTMRFVICYLEIFIYESQRFGNAYNGLAFP